MVKLCRPRSLVLLLVPVLVAACSSGGDGGNGRPDRDPAACNNSLHVVGMDGQGGVDGQFGAQDVVATLDDESLVLALSGYPLDGEIPEDAADVPAGTNLVVLEAAAPEGGFAEGQRFVAGEVAAGDDPADGDLVVRTFVRGEQVLEPDVVVLTLGPIADDTLCGAVETVEAGVDGTFKAGLLG